MAECHDTSCELILLAQVRDEKDRLLFVEKDGKFGGFKPEFLKEDVPSCFRGFIICTVCGGLMRGACGVGDPQVFMCDVCAGGESVNPLPPNRDVIMVMNVYCPLKSRGCEWEGTVSSLAIHIESCDHFLIDCSLGCGFVLARVKMDDHLTEACAYREIVCDYCGETHRETDSNLHLEVCVEMPLSCSNDCGVIIPRKDMQSHIEEACPNSRLECEYKVYGCDEMVARKDLETHKEETRILHMEMMMQSGIQSLNEELDTVKQENISIKQQFESLVEDNLVQENTLSDLTNEYATLKSELKAMRSDTKNRFQSLKNNHSTFVKESFKPLEDQVEVLIQKSASLEIEIAGKVSTVEPLTVKCRDLEFLSLFQLKRTFKLTQAFEKGPKCLSENWEELRRSTIRIVRITYEVVSNVDSVPVLRFTGIFSVRDYSHANINLCIVVLNYDRNSIHKLYKYSGNLIQEDAESVSDLPVQGAAHRPRSSSLLKRSHRTGHTNVLADIPMQDINQEGVCVDKCIFVQVYYSTEENDSH